MVNRSNYAFCDCMKLLYSRYIFISHKPTWHRDTQYTIYNIYKYMTKVVNSNPTHGEVYSIQHYVIKFVSDLRQVGGFLWVLRFPPPIKLTATIQLKYC